ncbi:SMP-30/gluconolactonase/LRE family protein [Sinimarinibacterium thermocellulolyticum]|uniref:SMP-30/gluconolactonase/LRE family protein n=1 Tax=Sinimarinibacterium thermocellulolyticum TaxID=3170016 RepID=A0ABV2A5T3_9GAMM
MRLLSYLVLPLAALAAYLLFWPVPIAPQAWQPPPLPTERYAPNRVLQAIERIGEGIGVGPEGLAIDAQGRLHTGYVDGRVMRMNADGSAPKLLAETGGRPLGLALAPDGGVLVADAMRGLLHIGTDGSVDVLADAADGLPFRLTDDVDRPAASRKAYFSDASSKFALPELMAEVFEHRPHGRLLEYDFDSGQVRTLLSGLYFANGVAVGPDEAYVLVTETTRYRVTRYWLKGERAGTSEVFIDNLPGFPDNISFNGSDRFWLALYAPRTAALDALLPQPYLRRVIFRLPHWFHPEPKLHAWVLGLDLDGRIVADLQYAGEDTFGPVTSVKQAGDALYLGSLGDTAIGRLPLSAIPTAP